MDAGSIKILEDTGTGLEQVYMPPELLTQMVRCRGSSALPQRRLLCLLVMPATFAWRVSVSTPLRATATRAKRARSDDACAPECALCGRPIPSDVRQSVHHLVPKLKGGAKGPTVLLHQICHNEIHATLTEAELAREFSTIAALRSHARLRAFVGFVESKPPDFYTRSQPSERRKRSRRR